MLPDHWGSDYDYAARMGHEFAPDLPREHFCCHRRRADSCGRCHGPVAPDDTSLLAAVRRHLDQMSVAPRLRHLADSDEETGAGLAARFGGE